MAKRNHAGSVFLVGLVAVLVLSSLGFVDPGSTGPAVAQFNASSIQKTAPVEAVQQIDLRLGNGAYPGCLDILDEPVVDYNNDNLELTAIAMIATCGWQPGETVKVTLMDPQGKLTSTEVKAVPARQKKGAYEADIFFQPGVDAPEGKYRFTIQGTSSAGTLKAKITYTRPKGAHLYAIPGSAFQPIFAATGGQQRLRLEGFLPNEPVRLLAYTFEDTRIKFYAWQDFVTDRRGQLIIETNLPDIGKDTEMNFYAYGRDTHTVALERFTQDAFSKTRQFDMDVYCPGAKTPQISGSTNIRMVTSINSMEIHEQPGFGSRVTVKAGPDTTVSVYGYPKCIDHAYWWKVSLSKPFLFGWVAESFLGKYLVEPVQK